MCLGFGFYVLELRSALAQNIAANGFGLVLATAFRFWSYRRFVFPEAVQIALPDRADNPDAPLRPTQVSEASPVSEASQVSPGRRAG